jgi:hypothetical protein
MNMRRIFLLSLLLAVSCKDPFTPDIKFTETNLLVVEGYINVGTDAVTTIRLARTVPVDSTLTEPLMETGATILIEDNQENIFPLMEQGNGIYQSGTLSLPPDREYRLRISTSNEQRYTSEFLTPIVTPAIDSVSWTRDMNGVDIYVNTHDPQNNTHYYQWDYEEIWEDRSPYLSVYKYENGQLVQRSNEEIQRMRRCWRREIPTELIFESTLALETDRISKKLTQIQAGTQRIAEKYSVLVSQHALSEPAFNYLQVMKKNSNGLGSFFDPQPSQLYSNIFSVDTEELVVGFLGAYSTSQVRLIIDKDEVPMWNYDMFCSFEWIGLSEVELAKAFGNNFGTPLTYNELRDAISATHVRCADCRFWGGDNNMPDFWDETF